ncbi:hypothetical protein DITRI_Ditri07aG0022400 [Diplodiscus trichospermus]
MQLKFNNTPTATILILVISLAASAAYNHVDVGDISPSAPLADDMVASSQSVAVAEQFEDLYQRCVVILGDDCGEEIFDLIFRHDTIIVNNKHIELVSKNCCEKLVYMGRHCHDRLSNVIAQTTDFSSNSSATLPRSSQVWDLCSLTSS